MPAADVPQHHPRRQHQLVGERAGRRQHREVVPVVHRQRPGPVAGPEPGLGADPLPQVPVAPRAGRLGAQRGDTGLVPDDLHARPGARAPDVVPVMVGVDQPAWLRQPGGGDPGADLPRVRGTVAGVDQHTAALVGDDRHGGPDRPGVGVAGKQPDPVGQMAQLHGGSLRPAHEAGRNLTAVWPDRLPAQPVSAAPSAYPTTAAPSPATTLTSTFAYASRSGPVRASRHVS